MERKGKNGGTLRSYEKGQSGNPAGRPTKKPSLISQIIQELGDDWEDLEVTLIGYSTDKRPTVHTLRYSTHGEQVFNAIIAARLLMHCVAGNMEAIKIVLDRTEGRARPAMNIDQPSKGPLLKVITYLPDKTTNPDAEL